MKIITFITILSCLTLNSCHEKQEKTEQSNLTEEQLTGHARDPHKKEVQKLIQNIETFQGMSEAEKEAVFKKAEKLEQALKNYTNNPKEPTEEKTRETEALFNSLMNPDRDNSTKKEP